jgi:hypothetical protein
LSRFSLNSSTSSIRSRRCLPVLVHRIAPRYLAWLPEPPFAARARQHQPQ